VTYRYVVVAYNVFGDSPQSEQIRVALGSLPFAPNAPIKNEILSTLTSITVSWNQVADKDGIAVTGYLLYMDDGYNGDFTVVYDGTS
jgi:hypothetical protein